MTDINDNQDLHEEQPQKDDDVSMEDASDPESVNEYSEEEEEQAAEEVVVTDEVTEDSGTNRRSPKAIRSGDDVSDTGDFVDDATEEAASATDQQEIDWSNELSVKRIAVELRRIEKKVREILENKDSARKRKLAGTARWHELEDDLLSWYGTGRFSEADLNELHLLVSRRHFLFKRLMFLSNTRPVWNS